MGRKGKAYTLSTDPMASLIHPEGKINHSQNYALKIINFSFVYFHSLACLLKQTNRLLLFALLYLTPIDSSIFEG